jgi:hypothetical protein
MAIRRERNVDVLQGLRPQARLRQPSRQIPEKITRIRQQLVWALFRRIYSQRYDEQLIDLLDVARYFLVCSSIPPSPVETRDRVDPQAGA